MWKKRSRKRKRLSHLDLSTKRFKMESNKFISKVLGARVGDNNNIEFYVQWDGCRQRSFLPNSVARKLAPNKILDFYEQIVNIEKKPK